MLRGGDGGTTGSLLVGSQHRLGELPTEASCARVTRDVKSSSTLGRGAVAVYDGRWPECMEASWALRKAVLLGTGVLVLVRELPWNGKTSLFNLRRGRQEAAVQSGRGSWVSCGPTTACTGPSNSSAPPRYCPPGDVALGRAERHLRVLSQALLSIRDSIERFRSPTGRSIPVCAIIASGLLVPSDMRPTDP